MKDTFNMNVVKFGHKLKLGRVRLNLTQTKFAKKIHSNQKSVSLYEKGRILPPLKAFVKIISLCNESADYFLNDLRN